MATEIPGGDRIGNPEAADVALLQVGLNLGEVEAHGAAQAITGEGAGAGLGQNPPR
jgi:hypothetical protein